MKKQYLILFTLVGALAFGCSSVRTTHVHTKLQTYEIDEQIAHGETTQKEILNRFGNRCTIEADEIGREMWLYKLAVSIPVMVKTSTNKIEFTNGKSFNSYQKPGYTNETHFPSKQGGFTPDFDTKNYTLAIFFDEDGKVISHHLALEESDKPPSWQSFDKSLEK